MNQFFKDFLLSGTKDKTFSSTLERDIVGNVNNFIFGVNSAERIKGLISDYRIELTNNRIAKVMPEDKNISWLLDAFTRLGGAGLEFYTNVDNSKENNLFTVSKMQSIIEINDYTDLTKERAVSDEQEINLDRFNGFKVMRSILKGLKSKDDLENRIYTQRLQLNIPGEASCYIYNIQSRVMIHETRVVYNYFCVIRNDIDFSLQELDKTYELDILEENNKTIRQLYKKKEFSRYASINSISQSTSDKYTYAASSSLNRNNTLIANLELQLEDLNSKYSERAISNNLVLDDSLKPTRTIIDESIRRLYSLNKNLNIKELDIAMSTIVAFAVNFNVFERNINYKIIDSVNNISSKDFINTIRLVVANTPDTDAEDYQERLNANLEIFKDKKINELKELSSNIKGLIFNDLWNMLVHFINTVDDLIIKTMYAENVGLFFKTPSDQEDKATMLIAAKNIRTVNIQDRNSIDLSDIRAEKLLTLSSSTRRLSNIISTSVYNAIIANLNSIIGYINTNVSFKIDEKTEKALLELESLTLEDVLETAVEK